MRIWICVVSLLCWASVACAQAPAEYPNVPLSDPAYADINLVGGPVIGRNCFSPYMTRYEFAVGVARICRFPSNWIIEKGGKASYEASIQNTLSEFKSPQEKAALARLVVQFTPELQELGIAGEQIEFVKKELATSHLNPIAPIIGTPFPDVPKTHWAFNAVESLRQSGIVIGFPENSFTKQSPAAPVRSK